MKKLATITLAIFAMLFVSAVAANAQVAPPTTGTITIKASVSKAASLRSVTDGNLNETLDFENVAPSADENDVNKEVTFRLRSNAGYTLGMSRTADSPSDELLDSSDVAMQVVAGSRSGGSVISSGSDSVDFTGTKLSDVAPAGEQLMSGTAISAQGNSTSADNFITATLKFSIKKEYYTAGQNFNYPLTVTIATP